MKTKLEQKETLQQLSTLKTVTQSLETDLLVIRQTQSQIEVELKKMACPEGPTTVHQIGNDYFCRKRHYEKLRAVEQQRQDLERQHQRHLEQVHSMKSNLAKSTKLLKHLHENQS